MDEQDKEDKTLRPMATPQQEPSQLPGSTQPPAQDPMDKYFETALNYMKQEAANSESEQQKLKARMKAQKARDLIGTIGRGLSAMGNLYYTTKGAPAGPAFNDSTMQQRYDKMMAQYNTNKDKITNLKLRIADTGLKGAMAKAQREQAERRQKLAELKEADRQKRADLKEERDKAKHELYIQRQMGLIDNQQLRNGLLEIEKKYADSNQQLKQQQTMANINRANAQAAKASHSGGTGKYYGSLPDKDGNEVRYQTKADYDRAKAEGIEGGWIESPNVETKTTTTKTTLTGPETTTKTTSKPSNTVVVKPKKQKKSPAQARREAKKDDNTMVGL